MKHFSLLQNKGRFYRVSLILVFSTFLTVIVIALTAFFISSNRNTNQKIQSLEAQNIEKSASDAYKSLEQVANMCNNFSTFSFDDNITATPQSNYSDYIYFNKQVKSYLSIFSQIGEISITTPSNYTYNSEKNATVATPDFLNDGTPVANIKNATFYYVADNDSYHSLYVYMSGEKISHANNTISISVNTLSLGKDVLNYNQDLSEYIVDGNGNVISAYGLGEIGENLKDIYSLKSFSTQKSQFNIKNGKDTYLTSCLKIEHTNLYVVRLINKDYYAEYFNNNILLSVVVCIAVLLLAVVICIVLLQYFYRPVKDILKQISRYQEINIEKSVDEVDYISNKLEQLYQSNLVLDEAAAKALRDLKTWNVAALQAQICPHFLYNTLDSINWIAYKHFNADNKISVAAQDTAYIMRKSLNITRMFCSVKEEIEITERYIDIIHIRYDNRFKIVWDVDDTLLEIVVPRLIIQPLIENAVIHAFSDEGEDDKITVTVKRKDDDIAIAVADNGLGISESDITNLLNNINKGDISTEKNVGLRNINQRCKIIFGEKYGISIESSVGYGTTFTVLIPAEKFKEY